MPFNLKTSKILISEQIMQIIKFFQKSKSKKFLLFFIKIANFIKTYNFDHKLKSWNKNPYLELK